MHGPRRLTPSALLAALTLALAATPSPSIACGDYGDGPAMWAVLAVHSGAQTQALAIKQLRQRGQAGLDGFLDQHANTLKRLRDGTLSETDPAAARIIQAASQIAAQKDAHLSGLYWYTDLAQATAQAKATDKQVLALRLLGNLDDALSCANSRLFRTVLYTDPTIQAALKDKCVLYWQPVRSAPVMTVDFGNGRRIQRTITGNSLHAKLDARGRVSDIMPGLVSPEAFTRWLTNTEPTYPITVMAPDPFAAPGAAQAAMSRTVGKADIEQPAFDAGLFTQLDDPARKAMTLTVAKKRAEDPALNAGLISPRRDRPGTFFLPARKTAPWTPTSWTPSSNALRIIEREAKTPEALSAVTDRLATALEADTAINLQQLQPAIRAWLGDQKTTPDLETATQWVYTNVFATPLNDPWMGLALHDTFTGLPEGGRSLARSTLTSDETASR